MVIQNNFMFAMLYSNTVYRFIKTFYFTNIDFIYNIFKFLVIDKMFGIFFSHGVYEVFY